MLSVPSRDTSSRLLGFMWFGVDKYSIRANKMVFTYPHPRSGFGPHGGRAEKRRPSWLPTLSPRFNEKQARSSKIVIPNKFTRDAASKASRHCSLTKAFTSSFEGRASNQLGCWGPFTKVDDDLRRDSASRPNETTLRRTSYHDCCYPAANQQGQLDWIPVRLLPFTCSNGIIMFNKKLHTVRPGVRLLSYV